VCGAQTLRTQDTSDLPTFGPMTLWHDRSVRTLRHYGRFGTRQLSSYIEDDQSHCILCDSFLPLVTSGVSVGQFEFEYYAKTYP